QEQLPTITDDSLAIYGYSQSAISGMDSNPYGPEIVIDGSQAHSYSSGFVVKANEVRFYDLAINHIQQVGIWMQGVRNCGICGCYIGVTADGMQAAGNGYGILLDDQTRDSYIAPFDTLINCIGGNTYAGIAIEDGSVQNLITKNIIGLNRMLTDSIPNYGEGGIRLYYEADSNSVYMNWIGGNTTGISIYESSYNFIADNFIGTDSLWQKQFGNRESGIRISSSFANSSEHNEVFGNWIGNNGESGILVVGNLARYNDIYSNQISANQQKGIENRNSSSNEIQPPYFYSFLNNVLFGFAERDQVIFIYTDEGSQGRCFIGSTETDEDGEFTFNTAGLPLLNYLTTIAIDTTGNTSEFSETMAVPGTEVESYRIPLEFSLFQNHPNPFNQSTAISYQLSEGCRVMMKVFDVLGREVVTLVDKKQPAGKYRVMWDAFAVSSGIYFYQIKAGDFMAVRKMGLVK
ncbi:NosD domain-containing protein, partial [bacterium]